MTAATPVPDEPPMPRRMKAVEVRAFGGLDAMDYTDLPVPVPGPGQVLVRVHATDVGPWDAWIREGRSVLPQPLPLILGCDLSGTVAAMGPGVTGFAPGDAVFGVTDARFTGSYAEWAVAEASMIARKPARLSHVEAASVPVVATTAWQMLFDRARVTAGQRVLVLGGAGNVGLYAVQLAAWARAEVTATAVATQAAPVRARGAREVVDLRAGLPDGCDGRFDAVIDTIGGDVLDHAYRLVRPGGALVSAVAMPDQARAERHGIRAEFILVSVTTAGLDRLRELFEGEVLTPQVGEVLPLSQARLAHEMLAGRAHRPGKIVLLPGA